MDQFKILPASIDDIPDIVTITLEAFNTDAVAVNMEKDVKMSVKRKRNEVWYRGIFEHAEVSGAHIFKVVDTKDNGCLTGFGKWHFPVKLGEAQKAEKQAWETETRAVGYAEGSNIALCDEFFSKMKATREKHLDPEKDYFMHMLAVAPNYHRRGIGSLILAEGLSRADEDGARTYIAASEMGLPLYLRHGWEVVDEVVIDLAKHGIEGGLYIEKCLMRQPKRRGVAVEEAKYDLYVGGGR